MLIVFKLKEDTNDYDYVGHYDGFHIVTVLRRPDVVKALGGEGEHEVFAAWAGQYGKRFRVSVPRAEATVTELS